MTLYDLTFSCFFAKFTNPQRCQNSLFLFKLSPLFNTFHFSFFRSTLCLHPSLLSRTSWTASVSYSRWRPSALQWTRSWLSMCWPACNAWKLASPPGEVLPASSIWTPFCRGLRRASSRWFGSTAHFMSCPSQQLTTSGDWWWPTRRQWVVASADRLSVFTWAAYTE